MSALALALLSALPLVYVYSVSSLDTPVHLFLLLFQLTPE